MTQSPTWLDVHQIERRRAVLQTVSNLLVERLRTGSSVEERFAFAIASVALKAVRNANDVLWSAENQAEEDGAAPVPKDVLQLVKAFNSIGPIRLKSLYRSNLRGPLEAALPPASDIEGG